MVSLKTLISKKCHPTNSYSLLKKICFGLCYWKGTSFLPHKNVSLTFSVLPKDKSKSDKRSNNDEIDITAAYRDLLSSSTSYFFLNIVNQLNKVNIIFQKVTLSGLFDQLFVVGPLHCLRSLIP